MHIAIFSKVFFFSFCYFCWFFVFLKGKTSLEPCVTTLNFYSFSCVQNERFKNFVVYFVFFTPRSKMICVSFGMVENPWRNKPGDLKKPGDFTSFENWVKIKFKRELKLFLKLTVFSCLQPTSSVGKDGFCNLENLWFVLNWVENSMLTVFKLFG